MSTTTTYTGVRIVDMPDLGAVNDASSVVGERAGSGRFAVTALRSYLNAYVAPGSGAVTRTITSKLAEWVSVKDFGAIGDNVADDTAAFQAGLTYMASMGCGRLYIPAGNYRITGPLTYSAGFLTLAGDGKGSTLQWASPTAVMATFSGSDITLSDFRVVTPYQTCTAGGLFTFSNANNTKLNRLWTDGGYDVVQFLGSSGHLTYRTSIADCNFVNVMCNGVFYDPYYGGLAMISDTEMLAAPGNNGNGLIIEAGDTFGFTNVNIQGFQFGISVVSQPGGINYAGVIHATNVLCDGGGNSGTMDGWLLNGGSGGTYVSRIRLTNCWAGVMGRHGFDVANASDVTFTNCIAIANGQQGFLLATPSSDITLNGCTAAANSASGSGAHDGIRVVGPVTDFVITGCRSRPNAGYTSNTQGFGINVDGAANDRYVVSNNNLHGNVTGGISDSSTGTPTRFVSQNII